MILKLGKKKIAEPTAGEVLAKAAKDVVLECCDNNSEALVVSPALASVSHATFDTIDEKQIRLRLLQDNCPFRPLSLCCVSFSIKNRGHVFLSNVIDTTSAGSETVLALQVPDQVSFVELRSMFRVPVVDSAALACKVYSDGTEFDVKVGDINLNGICFEESERESWTVGECLDIQLKLNESNVKIRGEIRNVTNTRVGVLFIGDKTEQLAKLVRELEMEFLKFKKNQ